MPEHRRAAIHARDAGEPEARDDAMIGQSLAVDAPANVPHEEPGIEIVSLHAHGPTLAPASQRFEHRPELLPRRCKRVAVAALARCA